MNRPSLADVPDTRAALAARLDEVLARTIAGGRIVGAVVAVAQHGHVVYRRAAGLADREAGRPLRPDAIFLLSSLTKPIVSLAAMALVEQGRLDLDAPVTRWLPAFRPRLADGREPAITVRHLLTHTAGLVYPDNVEHGAPYRDGGVSNGMDHILTGMDETMRRLAAAPLAAAPGERWIYSLAIDVLGAAIEAATGRPLGEAMRALVLAPLGMADTGFAIADDARLATPYADAQPRPVAMPARHVAGEDGAGFAFAPGRIRQPAAYPSGGAGMAGSADDMLKALEAIRTGHADVLSAAGAARMREVHVPPHPDLDDPGWGFGFGGAVLVDPAAASTPQSPGTLQWGGVYGHTWFVDAARGLSVVAMTNTSLEGLFGRFPIEVRDAVYA